MLRCHHLPTPLLLTWAFIRSSAVHVFSPLTSESRWLCWGTGNHWLPVLSINASDEGAGDGAESRCLCHWMQQRDSGACTHDPPPPPKWDMASHGGTGRRGGARSAGRGPKKRKVHEIAQVLCAIPFFKWIHFLIYLFTITLNHLLLWAKYRIASLCRPTQFINIVDNWIVQVICNCIVIYRQL